MGRYSSVEERDKEIVRLRTEGHLIGEISKETGIFAGTVRNVPERKGMLDWDPLKLMSDLDGLKKKVDEEGQRTRERMDTFDASINSFKKEMRSILSRLVPAETGEESGPEFTEMGSVPMVSSSNFQAAKSRGPSGTRARSREWPWPAA